MRLIAQVHTIRIKDAFVMGSQLLPDLDNADGSTLERATECLLLSLEPHLQLPLRYNSNVGIVGYVVEANNCQERSLPKVVVKHLKLYCTRAAMCRLVFVCGLSLPSKDQVRGGYDHRSDCQLVSRL